jgi:hypothetical protein
MIELLQRLTFGANGDARPFLGEGWSIQEDDFTWTDGPQSRIRVPITAGAGTLMLELAVNPMLLVPVLPRQRLIVTVNGIEVAREAVAGECSLGFDIPAEAHAAADALDIVLDLPDAAVPSALGNANPDTRQLGFAVGELMLFRTPTHPPFTPRARPPLPALPGGPAEAVRGLTGLSLPELAQCFESLGHNCELGLAQRAMGQEGLGLLRFGAIWPHKLLEGLDLGFEGIDAPDNLMTYFHDADPDAEIIVRDRRYGINIHSDQTERTTTREAVLLTFYRHLGFLRRKLLEDLAAGHKIFVFQHPAAKSLAHARPILNLLRSHGANSLLFVMEDAVHPSGTVVQVEDDLFVGYIRSLAPLGRVKDLDVASWISLCANAYRLWRESGHGPT